MSRGVLYLRWNGFEPRAAAALDRSIGSLTEHHPELAYHIETLPAGGGIAALLEKAKMADLTPFDETLFLDADTVLLGRVDHGFDRAARFGLACTICECPWAMRYPSCSGDIIEYNTGVLFFTRKSRPVFDAWARLAPQVDSSIKFFSPSGVATMPANDQAGFALAVEETGFNPFVLPMNWNFRPLWQKSWFGPIRIWHDYAPVPASVHEWNKQQLEPGAVMTCARAPS